MPEQRIEAHIGEVLTGEAQKNARALVAHLRANEMRFERGKGYWADKLYWMITYQGEYVCFILLNGSEDKTEPAGWVIWHDDGGTNCFADFPLDQRARETAWKHVDVCANCGGCKQPGGTRKTIFWKQFDNVCVTPLKFVNPDAEGLACVRKMIGIRKAAIQMTI